MLKYKTFIFVLLAFIFVFPITAGAHTHLESSSPEAGDTVTEENPLITLTFDSPVQEPNEVSVADNNGNEITIEQINHSSKNVIEVEIPEEIETGEVTLFYSIVGEDGHVMEEELTYTYETTEEEATHQTGEEPSADEESDNTDLDNESEEEASAENENSQNSWLLPTVAVGLVAAALLVFLISRKKS
ncbi:copper resistance CopC family protein [Halobacillus andaensis]|uniref:copper resistance CopC family protein n=1 Tax=Halobacillus andaensis TaxID=1176239 RepID=UPI003D745B97